MSAMFALALLQAGLSTTAAILLAGVVARRMRQAVPTSRSQCGANETRTRRCG